MGDRVSIAFKRGDESSVTLFSHWQGMSLVKTAELYVKELKAERNGEGMPLDRLEPHTVIVDFIRHITRAMDRVTGDLYLAKTKNQGDNSDNGHHVIKL